MQKELRPNPEWSTRSLQALRRITRALDVHSRRLYREWHITTPQMLCLQVLAKNGALTLSSLAGELSLSLSTVNGIVDRLEIRGLVNRTRSLADQRKVTLTVTPPGLDLLTTVPELMQDIFTQAFGRLSSEDRRCMTQLLDKLAGHLEPDTRKPAANHEIFDSEHDFISNTGTDYQLH